MAESLHEDKQKAENIFGKQVTSIKQRIWQTAAFNCEEMKDKFLSGFWKKTERAVGI